MMKRIIGFMVAGAIALSLIVISVCAVGIEANTPSAAATIETTVAPTISEDYIPSGTPHRYNLTVDDTKSKLQEHLIICEYEKPANKSQAENNKAAIKEYLFMIYDDYIPMPFEHSYLDLYFTALPSIQSAWDVIAQYDKDIEAFKVEEAEAEAAKKAEAEAAKKKKQQSNKKPSSSSAKKPTGSYPVATQVWNYMKNEFGWNDIVCAGIMGNLMAECGGCWTADLDWDTHGSDGLGMVQWIGDRRKAIVKKYGKIPTVEEQLQFMYDELHGTNGVERQVTNSGYKAIMEAKTPEDCAYAFAQYYERCHKNHRSARKGYARTAYEYFVN